MYTCLQKVNNFAIDNWYIPFNCWVLCQNSFKSASGVARSTSM